jgi:uncharacterized coiled-coil DUF342 family protein
MTEKQINNALNELRSEIDKLHLDNHDAKNRLNQLLQNIEHSLGNDQGEGHHDLIVEMRQAISHFEVEHPRITGIINDIMMTLSNLGI